MHRRLDDTCWDVDDVLSMCADAEERELDAYAQGYVDDIRARVMRWGDTMFFSERQENYLMTLGDMGLREKHRRERRPKWIKRAESELK